MKVLELFSGYGTASFALKRLGIEHELIGFSDIDKYANQCFKQNHGGKELGDIKLINPNELEDFDLLTGGFPCQAFSNAGKMQGELDPRGSLFYEIIRIAEVKKPKYMLLENVKGLTCKKFKDTFSKILSELDRIGYNVYWKVLNSKDYGIPQSRARVWFVCFRKDIDKGTFKFPEPTELKIFIKDILEKEVDKKYYLSPLLQERFAKYLEDKKTISLALKDKNRGLKPYGSYPREYHLEQNGEVSFTVKSATNEFLVYEAGRKEWRKHEEECPTLKARMGTGGNNVPMINPGQLRRLTPKECFRLMGFLNDEINLEGLSDTQKYKLAGNGQDVNMVSLIFKEMLK